MAVTEKITMDVFKVVFRAMAQSDHLDTMVDHITQLLVGALDIKGCAIFAVNPETGELEVLSSFGLSMGYINKGPLLLSKSIGDALKKEPVVISRVEGSNRLQYPQEAQNEGIQAIISLPIPFHGRIIGSLRLYHGEVWEVSEQDLDSLMLLAQNIGLAMMYTRVLHTLRDIKDTVNELHRVWYESSAE